MPIQVNQVTSGIQKSAFTYMCSMHFYNFLALKYWYQLSAILQNVYW